MNILMVLERVFPQDERVEKEIRSLMEEGHEVRIATYSFDQTAFQEAYNGYTIYRKRLSPLMYKLGAAIIVLPFYFNFWRRYLNSIYSDWKFDALHIHDLPLARLGHEFKKKREVRFVADQHEFYSSWIVKTAHYNTSTGRIIKFLSNWDAYENKYLGTADLVCTVEEPLRSLYLKMHGLDPERVIVIPNTPMKSLYSVEKKVGTSPRFNLFYCGGLDILRGLDLAIQALPLIKEEIPEIRLILVGKVNKHFDLRKYARELGVEDLLLFRGWVDYRELPYEIDQADICFFTPPANRDEIHNTIATKIYQYMARGKPVIVGSARSMKQFVEKNEIGLAIDESNPKAFANAVVRMHKDRELRGKYSSNARKNVTGFYWESTIIPLLKFYEERNHRQ